MLFTKVENGNRAKCIKLCFIAIHTYNTYLLLIKVSEYYTTEFKFCLIVVDTSVYKTRQNKEIIILSPGDNHKIHHPNLC